MKEIALEMTLRLLFALRFNDPDRAVAAMKQLSATWKYACEGANGVTLDVTKLREIPVPMDRAPGYHTWPADVGEEKSFKVLAHCTYAAPGDNALTLRQLIDVPQGYLVVTFSIGQDDSWADNVPETCVWFPDEEFDTAITEYTSGFMGLARKYENFARTIRFESKDLVQRAA